MSSRMIAGGVARDVEAGLEAVLQAHAGDGLGVDAVPRGALALDELAAASTWLWYGAIALIFHVLIPFDGWR